MVQTAFLSLVPGSIYLQASSMAERNTALANYLNEISGFRFPGGTRRMPIHEMMMGTSLAMDIVKPSVAAQKKFMTGTWAIPRTGTYKGDVGMVIDDTYDKRGHPGNIDKTRQCRMIFIPRLNAKSLESRRVRAKSNTTQPRVPVARLK